MLPGLDTAVGLLIAWFARKAGRDWKRLAGGTAEATEAVLDKAYDVIVGKLGEEPAIKQLESEVAGTGEAGTRTQTRVRLALAEAAERDETFADELTAMHAALRAGSSRSVRAVSPHTAGLTGIVGRETELRDLHAAFGQNRIQVLAGMGGVGKTSLARAYANRHLDDYGVVWWIRAEDPSAVDAEFRALLEVLLPPGQAARVGDARTAAVNLLARQQDPWLLVLDDVPDAAAAHGLLPPAGGGHVLITSRDPRWPHATTIEPLDTDAAVLLLGDGDEDSARALAAELDGLPLALAQAAGFVRANAISLATYLRLYRDRGAELHQEGKPADYPHTVATTWRLAMDRLTDPARDLLNLTAFFAPDTIPVHLLLSTWDELARHRALGELVSYGLVSPAGEHAITVHRLVQAVTRTRLHADQRFDEWADRAQELVIAARPVRPTTAGAIATWSALLPHIVALVEHLPPEHPATLTIRLVLAEGTGETGNPLRARELCAELLPLRERVSGPEHSDTLATKHALADWTGRAGLNEQARDLFAELLPVLERVHGAEHPNTLLTRHRHAHSVGAAGDPPRARDLNAELLPVLERVHGAEHRDTLFARQTLAHWTARAGNSARARELFAELLPVQERVLGAEDPVTLSTRNAMAHWAGFSGEAPLARELFAALLPVQERVFGAEHPDTLSTRNRLAFWTDAAGDSARARELYSELLQLQERVLGPDHPATVRTRQSLSVWSDPPPEASGEIQPPALPRAPWTNPPADEEGIPPGHSTN